MKKMLLKGMETKTSFSTCWIVETNGCLKHSDFQNDMEKFFFILSLLLNWNNRLFR